MTQAELLFNSTVDPRDEARLGKQQRRLLDRLMRGPLTNVEGVCDLRILNMTARVSELRQAGYRIDAQRGSEGVWTYRLVAA
jgi:hypothetical protein